jgi:hypothetical protein
MKWAVTLHKEGGALDGEMLACGPYDTRDDAEGDMAELVEHGHADVVVLFPFADEAIRRIREEE